MRRSHRATPRLYFACKPRLARRQERVGRPRFVPRPKSRARAETNAGPELSRVADANPRPSGVTPSPCI